MITTVCKISYGSQTVPPIVPAVQGDTGRAISFEIADFTPPAGATATYFILKPSGEAIYNSATITDNSILCELTAQSLAEAGENRMQVRVLQGEDIVTSFEVILMVRTFLGDDAMESGTEMNIFDQAVEQATEQFQENAEQIVEEVIESIPADYTALTEEVDELNERLSDVSNGLDFESGITVINNPDVEGHLILSTSFRRFWQNVIPAGSTINYVTIPITVFGGGAWIYVEIWELSDDGATLTRVRRETTTIVANSTLTFTFNYTSSKRCMIAQYSYGVQHFYANNVSGNVWFLSRSSTLETESITYSTLETYNNMYLIGDISYSYYNTEYTNNLPVEWRNGVFQINTGEIYSSPYGGITHELLRTDTADFALLNSDYTVRIGYYDIENGTITFKAYNNLAINVPLQINKAYQYFCISIFKSWETVIDPANCNSIVAIYTTKTVKESADTAIDNKFNISNNSALLGVCNKRYNLDFCSIAHQGCTYKDINNHNKIEGYVNAALAGFDYGETDVKMTSDNVPVCCHDATFVDATSGETVTINTSTYAELQGHNYYGGKLASFDDVCKTCKSNGIGIVIDQATPESVPYVSAILSKYSMWKKAKWMLVYRPEYPNLAKDISDAVIAVNPNANFIVDIEFDNEAAIAYAKTLKTAINDVWFHLPYLSYTTNQIAAIMEEDGAGYGMSVYTIDFLGKCKEYMPYVTGIISNQYSTTDILSF